MSKNLFQMVLQMPYVIIKNKFQCHRIHTLQGTGTLPVFLRDDFTQLSDLPVIEIPEADQLGGRDLIVVTEFVPFLLVVNDERRIFELGTDEALVVIGGAVYQVSEDLLLAPFSRRRLHTEFLLAELSE